MNPVDDRVCGILSNWNSDKVNHLFYGTTGEFY